MSIESVGELLDSSFDVVIFINDEVDDLGEDFKLIERCLEEYKAIFSPTGILNGELADSRNIYTAASKAIQKALKIGFGSFLLVLGPIKTVKNRALPWYAGDYPLLNAVLGALQALYQPLELREALGKESKYSKLGVYKAEDDLLNIARSIEEGRCIARDIGGSDPERMSASNIERYLHEMFDKDENISLKFEGIDPKKFPLIAAVDRTTRDVERHRGLIATLEYHAGGNRCEDVNFTLILIGKGITYDTGGSDVKADGHMAGMSRDKCGAAAIAGFMRVLSKLRPQNLCVIAHLALVRNGIGPEAFVADEIITSRAGRRIRVGNTDGEGRMVMADLLCLAKEEALCVKNPFLFTVATLTEHARLAYGPYTAVMQNGPARSYELVKHLKLGGDRLSDPVEISTIRKEDYEFIKGPTEYEDLLQCSTLPSSATPRGHQYPAAFMIMASGLDEHGLDKERELPYVHVDIAGSAGKITEVPTASPISTLTAAFILPCIWDQETKNVSSNTNRFITRQETTLFCLALFAFASVQSHSGSRPEYGPEQGSMSAMGGPMGDPYVNTMGDPMGRPVRGPTSGSVSGHTSANCGTGSQTSQKGGCERGHAGSKRLSPPIRPSLSPLAMLLRSKMEMCVRASTFGDIDDCVDCILEEDDKLEDLKKRKARTFCTRRKFHFY
ncbi:hypothetical protein Aperf_G00000037969 [Anoplocephala perfoliata]